MYVSAVFFIMRNYIEINELLILYKISDFSTKSLEKEREKRTCRISKVIVQ